MNKRRTIKALKLQNLTQSLTCPTCIRMGVADPHIFYQAGKTSTRCQVREPYHQSNASKYYHVEGADLSGEWNGASKKAFTECVID